MRSGLPKRDGGFLGSFHFQLPTRIGTMNRHDETSTHMRNSFVGVSDRFMEKENHPTATAPQRPSGRSRVRIRGSLCSAEGAGVRRSAEHTVCTPVTFL